MKWKPRIRQPETLDDMVFRTNDSADEIQRRSEARKADYRGQDLSGEALLQDYVPVEHNVKSPVGDVPAGSIVYTTWNGIRAKWLNGTVFVWRKDLEE